MNFWSMSKLGELIITTVIPMLVGFFGAYYIYKVEQTAAQHDKEKDDLFFISTLLVQMDYDLKLLYNDAWDFRNNERAFWAIYSKNEPLIIEGLKDNSNYLEAMFLFEQIKNYQLLYPDLEESIQLLDEPLKLIIPYIDFTAGLNSDDGMKVDFDLYMADVRNFGLPTAIETAELAIEIFKNNINHRIFNELERKKEINPVFMDENKEKLEEFKEKMEENDRVWDRYYQRIYDRPWFMRMKYSGGDELLEEFVQSLYAFNKEYEPYFEDIERLKYPDNNLSYSDLEGISRNPKFRNAYDLTKRISTLSHKGHDFEKTVETIERPFEELVSLLTHLDYLISSRNLDEEAIDNFAKPALIEFIPRAIDASLIAADRMLILVKEDLDDDNDVSDDDKINEKLKDLDRMYQDQMEVLNHIIGK